MRILWRGMLLTIYLMAQSHFVTFLDGQETTRTEFCVGDNLTLVCNGSTSVYTWTVGDFAPYASDLAVAIVAPIYMANGFTSIYVSSTESRLSFTVQGEHNGTEAICKDFASNAKLLTVTISVYGPPSAPMVTAIQNAALNSFNVGITSTDPASICISEYNITLTDSAGRSRVAIVPVNISPFDAVALFNIKIELCLLTYQFAVVASTGGGVGIANGEINIQGLPLVRTMIDGDIIAIDVPEVLQNCIVNLTYFFQNESGTFNANTDVLLLSMFNTETCTNGMLQIYPVILGEARASLGESIQLCESATTVEVTSMAPFSTSILTTDSASARVTAGAFVTMLGVTVALMAAML